MSRRFEKQYAGQGALADRAAGITLDWGTTVPADASLGYAPGCLFIDVDAASGSQLWINTGTAASASFKAISSDDIQTATRLTAGVGASTAGAGTTTADAGVLPAGTALVYPTTAADDTVGVRVNASDKVTGRVLFVGNGVANKILKIYPPTGGTINGGSADAAFSTASGKGAVLVCLSSSGNTWFGF